MTEENKQSNDSIEQQRKKERGEDIEPQRAQDKKEKRPEDKNPDDFE
ncbi:3-methyladenine DNA glycosylase [Domibacillus sp. 8LH]|nr:MULTISPECIES: 3-methyladenine DNA glycosylase [Domibacillus]MCI2253367.1 3-methyladenine DNA glycosylase [Domibacillus sp. PGB-M46]MCM3787824.1 3-methyladenine DNA glycosylase [Domibacillus indicus]WNS79968.1 3-methyladenine DNA glycosylase [Domibacillus sp. DTU_2020_1001157_1_SI_ALB_TIR_016]